MNARFSIRIQSKLRANRLHSKLILNFHSFSLYLLEVLQVATELFESMQIKSVDIARFILKSILV